MQGRYRERERDGKKRVERVGMKMGRVRERKKRTKREVSGRKEWGSGKG